MNSKHLCCPHSHCNFGIFIFSSVHSLFCGFQLAVFYALVQSLFWDLLQLFLRHLSFLLPLPIMRSPLCPLLSPQAPLIHGYWCGLHSQSLVMWPVSWLCPRARQPLWRLTGHSSAHTLGRLAELPPVAFFKQSSFSNSRTPAPP